MINYILFKHHIQNRGKANVLRSLSHCYLPTICIEFQGTSACVIRPGIARSPCDRVFSCKTNWDCNGGTCGSIKQNFPYTGKCNCMNSRSMKRSQIQKFQIITFSFSSSFKSNQLFVGYHGWDSIFMITMHGFQPKITPA